MSENPVKIILDAQTGEKTIIELTPEEIAELEEARKSFEEEQAEQKAEAQRIADLKASAKAKLISGEPLTEEEAEVITL